MIAPLEQHAARWWRPLPDGRILCTLCPRACRLADGQRGFCFIRQNSGGRMLLTSYGRSSGFCIDPVEKKPLYHFHPGTSVLSFGTAGCNLACRFCQNWSISKARDVETLADAASPARLAEAALRLGCRSVAFTYNDPVVFAEYAIDVADACRDRGLHPIAVTAGYISPEARPEFYAHMDAANVDLKSFSDAFYRRLCAARLGPVLDTLAYIRNETSVWLEVTTLLIPGENDSEPELHAAAEWFAEHLGPDVPWHFTAFHPDFQMLDKPRTHKAALLAARAIALSKGLRHVYTGNIDDRESATTYCGQCRAPLISRRGYEIAAFHLDSGRCPHCATPLPGHFDERPGTWGNRRQPIVFR